MKDINDYLKKYNDLSIGEISYEYIYKDLICYGNMDMNECIKDIVRVYADMIDKNKDYIELVDDKIIISNVSDNVVNKRLCDISIFIKLDDVHNDIDLLIEYCNSKKIKFNGIFQIYENVGKLVIYILDIENVNMLVNYINNKLSKRLYSVNPLLFSCGNVMLSINSEYSYIDIMMMYLYRYIVLMKNLKKEIEYDSFKDFILDNYYKIENQIEMEQYIEFNTKGIKLSSFFRNIDEITNIILYLFNGRTLEHFIGYIIKLNRWNSDINNKYLIYDNIDDNYQLLEELVICMYNNYGEEQTRDSIISYMDSGKGDYITRKNGLRKKITDLKTFIIYLRSISLEEEINKIINRIKFLEKVKILEDICKIIYINYIDSDNKELGKIQIARCLIRMQYGDYTVITRNNDARKMAIENIDSSDIIKLIKNSLCIDEILREEKLYLLYAEYIESLCTL